MLLLHSRPPSPHIYILIDHCFRRNCEICAFQTGSDLQSIRKIRLKYWMCLLVCIVLVNRVIQHVGTFGAWMMEVPPAYKSQVRQHKQSGGIDYSKRFVRNQRRRASAIGASICRRKFYASKCMRECANALFARAVVAVFLICRRAASVAMCNVHARTCECICMHRARRAKVMLRISEK